MWKISQLIDLDDVLKTGLLGISPRCEFGPRMYRGGAETFGDHLLQIEAVTNAFVHLSYFLPNVFIVVRYVPLLLRHPVVF